jgi:hypothetical protein
MTSRATRLHGGMSQKTVRFSICDCLISNLHGELSQIHHGMPPSGSTRISNKAVSPTSPQCYGNMSPTMEDTLQKNCTGGKPGECISPTSSYLHTDPMLVRAVTQVVSRRLGFEPGSGHVARPRNHLLLPGTYTCGCNQQSRLGQVP